MCIKDMIPNYFDAPPPNGLYKMAMSTPLWDSTWWNDGGVAPEMECAARACLNI